MSHGDGLRYEELGTAPTGPGIYAWYAVPEVGKMDWQDENSFSTLLSSFSGNFVAPELRLHAASTFLLEWEGSIVERTSTRLATALGQQGAEQASAAFRNVCESSDDRRLVAKALPHAVPLLASPLYVGMARNLRERLATHRQDIADALALMRDDPHDLERVGAQKFGQRAIAAGFRPDILRVWTVDLSETLSAQTQDVSDDVILLVEWLLNRWFRPVLGRR